MSVDLLSCREARAWVALAAGHDLPDADEQQRLAMHLRECAACRRFQLEMAASQRVLATVAAAGIGPDSSAATKTSRKSASPVWDRVGPRLARLPRRNSGLFGGASSSVVDRPRFNGWLPATVVAAACLMIVVAAANPYLSGRGVRLDQFGASANLHERNLFETDENFANAPLQNPAFNMPIGVMPAGADPKVFRGEWTVLPSANRLSAPAGYRHSAEPFAKPAEEQANPPQQRPLAEEW
jgi:hypothetical protein